MPDNTLPADLSLAAAADTDVDEIQPLAKDTYYENEPVKLTEAEIAQIWRRIEGGLLFQEKKFLPTYKDANLLWQGQHWPMDSFANHWDGHLVINVIPNTIKSLVKAVTYSKPDITIVPRNAHGEATQTIIKAALDYWIDQAHVEEQVEMATWDSKLYGLGILQTGWLFKTEQITLEEGRLEVTPGSGASATRVPPKGPVPEEDVIEDRFLAKRINPVDMVFAPNATAIADDWDWVVKINRRPLAEVRRDPRYRNKGASTKRILATKDLAGTTELSEPYDTVTAYLPEDIRRMKEEERPPDTRYVEEFEYYERDRRLHVTLCKEDRTRYLLAEKWTWRTNRYPFLVIPNTHTPDELYGKSVPIELWHLQIELNVARSNNLEHARQFNRMYQCPEDCLSDTAINALESGQPGGIVQYKAGPWGANPISQIPHLQLQPEIYQTYQWALQGIEQISGLSQYQMHAPPTKRLTVNESQAIQGAGGILFLADAQAVTKLWKEVCEDCLAFCEQFDAVIDALPIYDAGTDTRAFGPFSGKEIRANTMVEIWPESTQPPDAQSELQKNEMTMKILLEAAQIAQQNQGQLPRPFAITFREGLRILGVRNIDQLIPLPPVPPVTPSPALPMGGPPGGMPPGGPSLPPGPQGPPPAPPGPPAAAPPAGGPTVEQIQQALNSMPPELIAALLHGDLKH